MAYEVTWSDKIFYARFFGNLTAEEITAANNSFFTDERSFRIKAQVFDFSEVENFVRESLDPKNFAAIDIGINTYIQEIKGALVVRDNELEDLCREYIAVSQKLGSSWSFGLFDNLEDAKKWIESE